MPDQGRNRTPRPDPLPPHSMMVRFRRIMKWMALVAIVVAGLAVLLVAIGDDHVHIHMLIATALGVGLSVLLGTALMTLVFLSNRHGHDAEAHHVSDRKDKE